MAVQCDRKLTGGFVVRYCEVETFHCLLSIFERNPARHMTREVDVLGRRQFEQLVFFDADQFENPIKSGHQFPSIVCFQLPTLVTFRFRVQ